RSSVIPPRSPTTATSISLSTTPIPYTPPMLSGLPVLSGVSVRRSWNVPSTGTTNSNSGPPVSTCLISRTWRHRHEVPGQVLRKYTHQGHVFNASPDDVQVGR